MRSKNDPLPKISIITPNLNKGEYIEETIKSVLSQKYHNLEYIIVDGGSTDKSLSVINKYKNNLKLIILKSGGQVGAINYGIKHSSGEIVGFINSDDIYKDGAFKKVAQAYLENKNSLWFAGEGETIDQDGNKTFGLVSHYKNSLLHINNFSFLLIVNYLFQQSIFITRKAYQRFGPFSGIGKIIMEYDMWLKLAKEKMPIIIKSKLSSFRLTPDGLSLNLSNTILKNDSYLIKKYTNNPIFIFFHFTHNWFRIIISKGNSFLNYLRKV